MARYVVLERDGSREALFVRDGFTLLAFLFPLLWFLMHRMWREFLLVLVASMAVSVTLAFFGMGQISGFAVLLLQFAIGLEAQNIRVASLMRREFRQKAAICAFSIGEAEIRYFHAAGSKHNVPVVHNRRSSLVPHIGLLP